MGVRDEEEEGDSFVERCLGAEGPGKAGMDRPAGLEGGEEVCATGTMNG